MARRRITARGGDGRPIQVQGLRELQRDLRKFAPDVARALRAELRKVVKVVAVDAKHRAPRRTGNLARKIRPSVTAKRAAVVSAARYGHVIENGGRHPVYGNRENWVNQSARPYLKPAADAHSKDVERGALDAIDKAAKEAGF
jgi:phage gpG-like protein